jgi:hypothetical protein
MRLGLFDVVASGQADMSKEDEIKHAKWDLFSAKLAVERHPMYFRRTMTLMKPRGMGFMPMLQVIPGAQAKLGIHNLASHVMYDDSHEAYYCFQLGKHQDYFQYKDAVLFLRGFRVNVTWRVGNLARPSQVEVYPARENLHNEQVKELGGPRSSHFRSEGETMKKFLDEMKGPWDSIWAPRWPATADVPIRSHTKFDSMHVGVDPGKDEKED